MRTIAVYPGRFHPFHKGHAASFKQLAEVFGLKNTFLAISQKQEQPKSPFSAIDRAKMAMSLGIPKENIITVKNTYSGQEYMNHFESMGVDVNNTALIFGVSQKDMGTDPRFSFNDKKDGSPSYMQPVSSGVESPMSKHAYVMTTDVAPFTIAGATLTDASQIRSAYAKGDDKLKVKILTDLYGKNAKHIKPIFDQNLAIMESVYNKLIELKQKISESKETVAEKWSQKYKSSINCSNPKGFSQRAHCQGRNKNESTMEENTESKIEQIADYDTWSDIVKELGGEIHAQKDRNLLIAQSWDGEEIGKFHLGKNMGFVNKSNELDETIRKVGSQYRLLSKKGKNLGTFDSKAGAEKHEREVQYFKHMNEDYLDE
jgi:hypothetical protein